MLRLLLLLVYFALLHSLNAQRVAVLITAPEGYGQKFAALFDTTRFAVETFPALETVVPASNTEVKRFLRNIGKYDYVAFSSTKAVEAFYQGICSQEHLPDNWTQRVYFAIGNDGATVREKLGIEPVLPKEPSPMGIVETLSRNYAVKKKRIAVLVPKVTGLPEPYVVPEFLQALKYTGLHVKRIDAYITRPTDVTPVIKMIRAGQFRCVAFTSSAEIESLLHHLSPEELNRLEIACFGRFTARFARQKGLTVDIEGQDFSSFKGFVAAIETYFYRR